MGWLWITLVSPARVAGNRGSNAALNLKDRLRKIGRNSEGSKFGAKRSNQEGV